MVRYFSSNIKRGTGVLGNNTTLDKGNSGIIIAFR
jgi:hypothetical protein